MYAKFSEERMKSIPKEESGRIQFEQDKLLRLQSYVKDFPKNFLQPLNIAPEEYENVKLNSAFQAYAKFLTEEAPKQDWYTQFIIGIPCGYVSCWRMRC